ncbi:MAG: pyridoxal 5'-phosphate synthase glutaminase subunit PdxT [Treponema sp.]|nr:pyridoxal 5'-phosphate synthase glutaminase subunit PdxT [Treponema sp.]
MTAVLSVQGDFAEHEAALHALGEPTFELRQKNDLERPFDRLVLPGGESTVQRKLVTDLGMYEPLRERIGFDIPVFATCAGLILLADYFKTLPVTVRRNAYGRQTGSFYTEGNFKGIGPIPMTFIRAPFVEQVQDGVVVKSVTDGHITGVQYRRQLGISFHPEMNGDSKLYAYFLAL